MFRHFHAMKGPLSGHRRGQSTLEYAVLVIIIVGALLTVQNYIKRGVQGRLKSSTDDIGDQYSEGNTNAIKQTKVHSKTKELFGMNASGVAAQGISVSQMIDKETTNTVENSQILNSQQEYWGK